MKRFPGSVSGSLRVFFLAAALAVVGSGSASAGLGSGFTLGPLTVMGDGAGYAVLGAGVFDAIEEGRGDPGAELSGEVRFGRKLFVIGPVIGIEANTDGGVYGYGGFYLDARIDRFVITPVLALGGYKRGGSKDLGGVFEFRVALDLSYEFPEGDRLGLRVAHISNAGIHDHNPGEEEFLVTYAIPFSF